MKRPYDTSRFVVSVQHTKLATAGDGDDAWFHAVYSNNERHDKLRSQIERFVHLRRMFISLCERAELWDQVAVTCSARLAPDSHDKAGWFYPPQDEGGFARIEIFRRRADDPEDPLAELVTLAHEVGHLRSWQIDRDRYMAASPFEEWQWRSLSKADRIAIFNEEQRAWVYAQRELAAVEFAGWRFFNGEAEAALCRYLVKLDLVNQDWLGPAREALRQAGVYPEPMHFYACQDVAAGLRMGLEANTLNLVAHALAVADEAPRFAPFASAVVRCVERIGYLIDVEALRQFGTLAKVDL